jgi:hypothetical protein
MKSYVWSCLACEASNPPDNAKCSRCGCPARATSAQVDAALQAWRQRSGLPPVESFDLVAALMAFPLLLIAAGVLALLGAMALMASTSVSFTAFGALLLALAALCVSSYRPRSA